MESFLIGSLRKPSFPGTLQFSSLPFGFSHVPVHGLKCKAFSNTEKLYEIIPKRLQFKRQINLIQNNVIQLNPKRGLTYIVNSAFEQSLESEPSDKSTYRSLQNAFDAFYRFSRPHTMIGTIFGISSVSLLAVEKLSDFSPLFFNGVLKAIVAALLMNIYVVGLNQLTDIEIDKVNKPYLPLASGEYSITTGVMVVLSSAILSFLIGWLDGSWPLLCAIFVHFSLGTAYSVNLPLLRWKRFSVVAAMCIFIVRAVNVQLAFYSHVKMYVYGRPVVFAKPIIFATAVMSFFSIVIALFKDIPDIAGDKVHGIQSLTVRLGQKRVFWICIFLLEMAYVVALFVGATSSCTWSKWTTVIGHSMLGLLLWHRARSVDLTSKTAITSFYMFIWKLFYAEYLLIPLVRDLPCGLVYFAFNPLQES